MLTDHHIVGHTIYEMGTDEWDLDMCSARRWEHIIQSELHCFPFTEKSLFWDYPDVRAHKFVGFPNFYNLRELSPEYCGPGSEEWEG